MLSASGSDRASLVELRLGCARIGALVPPSKPGLDLECTDRGYNPLARRAGLNGVGPGNNKSYPRGGVIGPPLDPDEDDAVEVENTIPPGAGTTKVFSVANRTRFALHDSEGELEGWMMSSGSVCWNLMLKDGDEAGGDGRGVEFI